MKYWVIFFFVLASFRSDDGEVAHIEETGHHWRDWSLV